MVFTFRMKLLVISNLISSDLKYSGCDSVQVITLFKLGLYALKMIHLDKEVVWKNTVKSRNSKKTSRKKIIQ